MQRHIRGWLTGLAVAAMLLTSSGAANASPVLFDVWYSFQWFGVVPPGGSLPTFGGGLPSPFLTPSGDPPWEFTAGSDGAILTVTDLQADIDSFAIYDFGVLIGSTPLTNNVFSPCGLNPDACIAADYSHGSFFFGAGAHAITMRNVDPNGIEGTGAFRVDAVPEPATLILLGSGIAGLGFARRRKSA